MFEQELDAAVDRALLDPNLGRVYPQSERTVAVRRLLLPRTRNHLYYSVRGDELIVLSVWGATKRRGPRL